MSTVSSKPNLHHAYELIRERPAPLGTTCPHCQCHGNILYSGSHLHQPLLKRFFLATLRCHDCSHRFTRIRMVPLAFWAGIALLLCLIGLSS